jgi:tape measure domain-containing protein
MAVSQELVAKFKAETADFNNKINGVKKEIDSVGASGKKMSADIDASANKASKSFTVMSVSAKGVATAISGATVAIGAFSVKVGSDMESATKRIEAMLGSVEKANYVLNNLRQAGYDSGASVIALTESYGKLATFVQNGSISLQESVDLQKGLTSTSTALGASSDQLSTVMYGLSQAMGSGIVRAEEFNQVTEPLPGIINRMEQASGLASGELRGMVNDGLITSEMFKNILIPALKSFDKQAEEMKGTLKVQAGIMANTATALGEDLYEGIAPSLTKLTILLNNFSQQFVSVKRASKEELQRRLSESMETEQRIKNSSGIAGGTKFGLNSLYSERQEIANQLNTIDPVGPFMPTDDTEKSKEKTTATDPTLAKLQEEYRKKLSKGRTGTGGATKTRLTEAQKEANEQVRIREQAIASAKQSIATSEAEVSTMRMLSHEKKMAIELNKLQAVGISENSKEYNTLSVAMQNAYTAELRMKEGLDLEKYVVDKRNENEALQDQAKFIGMTSHEIAQYNIAKELQIDLEQKSIELTKEGFEEYKKTAKETAERKMQIMEQNKAYTESFQGGIDSIMARAREDVLTEADVIQQGYEIMSSNISDTLVGMADGTKNSFKEMARSIIQDIQKVIIKALIMRAITSAVGAFSGGATGCAEAVSSFSSGGGGSIGINGAGGFLSGARANGGSVGANKMYLVGERGPEILKMGSQSGNVISNENSFGGSTVINIDARGASAGVEQQIRRVMGEVVNLKKQVPNIAISAVREQNSRNSGFLR